MKKKSAIWLRCILTALFTVILFGFIYLYWNGALRSAYETGQFWFGLFPFFAAWWLYCIHRTAMYLLYIHQSSEPTVSLFTRTKTKKQQIISICLLGVFALSLANIAVLLWKNQSSADKLLTKNLGVHDSSVVFQTTDEQTHKITFKAPQQAECLFYYTLSAEFVATDAENGALLGTGKIEYGKLPKFSCTQLLNEFTINVHLNRARLENKAQELIPLQMLMLGNMEVRYFYNDERQVLCAVLKDWDSVLYVEEIFEVPPSDIDTCISDYIAVMRGHGLEK